MLEQMLMVAWAAMLGLVVGSGINALVWRLHEGTSWVHGRSHCSHCGHMLAAKDLVPVLSWVILGGKCRYCHRPITDGPAIELATGVSFGLSMWVLYPGLLTNIVMVALWFVLMTLLLALAAYDWRWMLLPDKLMIPLVVLAGVATAYGAIVLQDWHITGGALAAAVLAGGVFWIMAAASKGRAMGGGDIKLAFAMGLMLGLQSTAVAMFIAFNVAAIAGVVLIVTKRRGRRDHIPFGPYLVLGTIIAYLYGRDIVAAYLRLGGIG
ncbi:prepilin peptidase [bacterium]|nr:MAG: prepilin peptidase [bacterium]